MIKLVAVRDDGHSYPVAFATPRQALDFVSRKTDTALVETEDRHLTIQDAEHDADALALYDHMHPACHHGLSAELCMDPVGQNHWGTIEQELAGVLG